MSELIDRPEYLERLIQNKDVDLVKIVTGIRRCGKSSLLDLFHQYLSDSGTDDSHIIHMNMESLRYRELSDYLALYDYISERIPKEGKTYNITKIQRQEVIKCHFQTFLRRNPYPRNKSYRKTRSATLNLLKKYLSVKSWLLMR